jgi:flagellar motor switch protein FliM
MDFILEEYERCWQPVYHITSEYLRTETNPQFLTVVPLSDVVLVTSFEIEMENLRGTIQIVIPYSTVEPIRHHLTSGIQSEEDDISISWYEQIEYQLQDSEVEIDVLLGRAQLTVEQMLDLKVGDVLMLDQSQDKPLKLRIEHSEKYRVEPVERSGVISVRVVEPILKPPIPEPNKSYK